jgi:hypothetical protein
VSENKENPIDVIEEIDGSAVVELPEGEAPIEQEEHHEDDQPTTSDMSEDEKEAVREANRQRRHAKKQYAREKRNAEKAQLDYLKRQNQELMDRLSIVERISHNAELSKIDAEIQDEYGRMQYAQSLIREATENSDGNGMAKAQEAYLAARDRLIAKQHEKQNKQIESVPKPRVDPRMIDMAKDWMARNPWYDPSGKDEDSQIAKLIDERMVSEGWDPTGDDYWEEFDNRLQRRLPNRYTESNDERRRKPKSFVTGSVRESVGERSSSGGYVLSPERVRAIKEAGMWDDQQKRQRMIRQFIQYDKINRS